MPSSDVKYRLVVFESVENLPPVRDLFCEVTGAHSTDATQWVAKVPGVWPQPLPEDQVRRLLDGLYQLEIAAEAWRVDKYPDVAPPRLVHDAGCMAEGFRVKGLRGEPTHWVPWDKFDLISAGKIVTPDEFREVTPASWVSAVVNGFDLLTGRRPGSLRQRHQRALRIPRAPVAELILVRRDPLIAFRIVETGMNYAYLGSRLRPSAAENFPILLADLIEKASKAYVTPVTEALLEGEDPSEYEFPTSQALFEYSAHRLLWAWYRRDRDAREKTQN